MKQSSRLYSYRRHWAIKPNEKEEIENIKGKFRLSITGQFASALLIPIRWHFMLVIKIRTWWKSKTIINPFSLEWFIFKPQLHERFLACDDDAIFSQWRHVSDVIWLLSEPKNQQYTSVLAYGLWSWGVFCETMDGGVHRYNETLTLSAAHTLTAYTMGVPPGFQVFCIGKSQSTGHYSIFLRTRCFVYLRSGRILFAM